MEKAKHIRVLWRADSATRSIYCDADREPTWQFYTDVEFVMCVAALAASTKNSVVLLKEFEA